MQGVMVETSRAVSGVADGAADLGRLPLHCRCFKLRAIQLCNYSNFAVLIIIVVLVAIVALTVLIQAGSHTVRDNLEVMGVDNYK